MGLSKKVFLLSLLTSIVMVGLIYLAAEKIFETSYQQLEQQHIIRDTERAERTLEHELDLLHRRARDWALWEEAYQYAIEDHPNPDRFAAQYFSRQMLSALGITDLLFLSPRDGRIIGGRLHDQAQPGFSEPVQASAQRLHAMMTAQNLNQLLGYDRLGDAPVMLAMIRVSGWTVARETDFRAGGFVLFAVRMDEALMARLGQIARLQFLLEPANSVAEDQAIWTTPLDQELMLGHFLLRDIAGDPFMRGTVTHTREIVRQGRESLLLMLLALIAVGLAMAAVSQWITFSLVLSRVSALRDSVRRVAAGGRMDERLPVSGDDELADLAHDYNKMLEKTFSTQKALQRAMLEAEHASQQKSDFLANMSHEIRTPMTAVLGYAELLLENEPGQQESREYLATIHKNSEILIAILNDILDLSKIEVGKLHVNQSRVHLGQLLHSVVSLFQPAATRKGLDLRVEFDGPVPQYIHTDGLRLQQILVNLVGNAVASTAEGYVELRLYVDYSRLESTRLRLEVIDTGIGINEERLRIVFDPFMRQPGDHMNHHYGGTGLGLAISQRLAKLLGGDIKVQSSLGQGSCFQLEINAGNCAGEKLLDSPVLAMNIRPLRADEGEAVQLQGLALVVEDNLVNMKLVQKILENAGMDVVTAENGRQACDYLASRKGQAVDIVMMDMHMPVMDGYSAVREIRRQGNNVPIIALSANTLVQDQERCIRAGCDAFAGKPINRDELLAMCRRWLFKKKTLPAG